MLTLIHVQATFREKSLLDDSNLKRHERHSLTTNENINNIQIEIGEAKKRD